MFKTQTHDTRTVQLRANNMVTMVLWVWVLANSPRRDCRDCPIHGGVLWVKQSRVKTDFVAFLFVTFISFFFFISCCSEKKRKIREDNISSQITHYQYEKKTYCLPSTIQLETTHACACVRECGVCVYFPPFFFLFFSSSDF